MSNFRLREAIGEIGGGSFLIVLGIVWAVVAGDYGLLGDGGRLAPGTLPFICGVGLALTGAVIVIKAVFKSSRSEGADDSDALADLTGVVVGADETAPTTPVVTASAAPLTTLSTAQRIRSIPTRYPIVTVYGLVVACVAVMPILGFAAAFALGIFAILRLVEQQTIRTSALVGIVTALLGYVLFEVIFNLPLPEPFFL